MANKLKYKPTKKVIGIDTGFIQASVLLDIASVRAVESGDFNAVANIADKWIELSRAMKEVLAGEEDESSDDDDEEDSLTSKRETAPIGFGVTSKEIQDYHGRASKG